MAVTERDMIRVDDFIYLYRLKESKESGTMNSCPGSGRLGSSPICHLPSNIGNRGSFLCLGMNGRLLPMNSGVAFLGYSIVREPRV